MSYNVLNNSLILTQHVVRAQVEHFNYPEPKGHMRRLPKSKIITNRWKLNRNDHSHVSSAGVNTSVDMHAKLEQDASEE